MPTIDLNYNLLLKSARPKSISLVKKGLFGASRVDKITIPPLNTDIRVKGVLQKYDKSKHTFSAEATLPETWDWRNEYPSDTEETKQRKKLISPPRNQELCGSCWAVSSATVISDIFVASGVVNPNISATYILSCYEQSQCGGGNPAVLFGNANSGGVASEYCKDGSRCISYDWCNDADNCNGSGTKHFQATPDDLNKLIPKCSSFDKDNKVIYFVNDPSSLVANTGDDASNIIATAKSQIYNYGPIVGVYLVPQNFFGGDYSDTGGVYLEDYDYSAKQYLPADHQFPIEGGHAVAVLGWGVSKGVNYRGKNIDIPYWYCRNSWASSWGEDGGYFKIAMYPFNKIAQFDVTVTMNSSEGTMEGGGLITCKPGAVKGGDGKPFTPTKSADASNHTMFYLFLILLLIFVLIILYRNKNKYE